MNTSDFKLSIGYRPLPAERRYINFYKRVPNRVIHLMKTIRAWHTTWPTHKAEITMSAVKTTGTGLSPKCCHVDTPYAVTRLISTDEEKAITRRSRNVSHILNAYDNLSGGVNAVNQLASI